MPPVLEPLEYPQVLQGEREININDVVMKVGDARVELGLVVMKVSDGEPHR